MAAQLLLPAIKALASGGVKKAVMGAAKGAVKGKAKDFVTGKNRKGKGKGGALTKSEGGGEEQVEGGKGGAIVPTTPMVGNYKVETLPDKPDEVGKPSKISYESINNQLDSIIGLTNVLKKTSAVKLKNSENRRKAERKASEKAKKRQRESLLERGAGKALGMAGNLYGKATQGFDPLKFFTMIFLGSLFNWVTTHGSKIIGFLKVGLALFNNAGKILKSGFKLLGKTFKAAFKLVGKLVSPLSKLSKSVGGALKSVGKKLGSVFGKVGKSLKNFALGIIKKLKALGTALNPLRSLRALTGGEKKALQANKGLSKITKTAGGVASNAGTASRATGTMSNATRALRVKHGDEAARMYQGLVDNGMKPSRAAQYVNKSIASGKLTSAPLEGSLAGGKKGSQLFKGGIGRSTNRVIARLGGKTALKVSKGLMAALDRIPIVGSLITGIVSILAGDPAEQTLFKVGGAALGGALGSVIPVFGTIVGEIIGEWVGDLLYHAIYGGKGDVPSVGEKFKQDWQNAIMGAQWLGDGFGRLYEGIPKFKIPEWIPNWMLGPTELLLNAGGVSLKDIEIPNPFAMLNPFEMIPLVHKAFFTEDPMEPGEVKEKGDKVDINDPNRPAGVTNMSTVTTVKPERAGDFVVNSAGQLRVFDGQGYAGATPEQQKLYESGATNIDGTKAPASTGSGGVYGSAHLKAYAMKNGITDPTELAMFMAQMSHESGSFRYAEEIHDGSDYEGSSILGNNQPGDGPRFKGRGYIQLTGRWNYGHYGKMVGVDLVNNPQLAADPDIAAAVAIAYYMDRVDRDAARRGDVKSVTYAINGGYNGLADRQRRFDQYMSGKTPEGDVKGSVSSPQVSSPSQSEGEPVIKPQENNSSESLESSETTPAATPAQVTPSTQSQTQMSNGISGISQQLSYEQTGNTVVMIQGSGGQQIPMGGGGGKGTPVIMGSGDVVNSYYKSQLMGFLYKRG